MPSSTRRTTRSNAAIADGNSALPAAKRSRRQPAVTTSQHQHASSASANTDMNLLPTPAASQQPQVRSNQIQPPLSAPTDEPELDLDVHEINLRNYHQVIKHWPLGRIADQLNRQKSSNHQISEAVIAEGKAVLERLEISLHMIAMVSHINILTLKRSLGLIGATHADNPWHKWLSFAKDANKLPMPTQGDPNSAAILAARNKANKRAYDALTLDELAVFKSPMFFALGGYPDYSAITFSDDDSSDAAVLIPEVPKLSEADELRYRPIYNKLVNTKKVDRDWELNKSASSAAKEEKRSLLSFKKIAQQLERDRQQLGMDYYIIACSNNGGEGWCREHSSNEDIVRWVGEKAQLPRVFQLYCQHGSLFEDI
ncbi:uncharacterized protein MELLADRAFT_90088 [Melampsora larici-populina 98AG31]|uniref:Uncharacterized protein n=1 Tax=Melampsora larici-populina (strain 98AG31 / pathotype 3-4-7) TaxID=747676 RepID=F4RVM1_MELLP|nr:uncharacterized protein MELLADRAFT_90088 [Melampsora larici-populina 98AG31]EGG03380.1 hypothetical protein MELLADRAFT_90088 [Melampsora larici-populina 98AG31]